MIEFFQSSAFSLICLILVPLITCHHLQFNSEGEFTILQFSDLHYFGDVGPEKDVHTQNLQIKLIQEIKPDLVVITGDAVQILEDKIEKEFVNSWKKFTKPMMDAKIPYAYVLGNHDAEELPHRRLIAKLDETNPWSMRSSCEGIPETTNFAVPIYSSRNPYELAANLWMLDSGSVGCDGFISSWGCIEEYVVDWYRQQSDKIKEIHGENVHHLAFFHVPLPEVVDLYNNEMFSGDKQDPIGCPYINTGFFDAVKEKGDISGIFTGHDHMNSFVGWYRGVEFVYGIKSGYNTYGEYHGARVLKLKENYNEKGELNVTRSHYALFDSGVAVPPTKWKRREGPKVPACQYPGTYSQMHQTFNKWCYDLKKWLFG